MNKLPPVFWGELTAVVLFAFFIFKDTGFSWANVFVSLAAVIFVIGRRL